MKSQRGMSLAEVLIALSLIGVTILASLSVVNGALTGTRNNMDKQFATQKAIAMLEELRSLIQGTGDVNASTLDDYDDGVAYRDVLTTQRIPSGGGLITPAPDAEVSGNLAQGPGWLYSRRIQVTRLPSLQSANVRLVRVQVFKNTQQGPRLLAEVASVLNTVITPFPPTQVYDVYALAVENVPGWWVYMSNLVPFVADTVGDLQSRNPGLQYRMHWIRRLSYGRDQQYTPFLNATTVSTNAINQVYFYPGLMPAGSSDDFYYSPQFFAAKINIDGTVRNGYDATVGSTSYNPNPYALADQYNHSMRLEDERALFNARVASGQEAADTPTWRLLLEDMYNDPNRFRNAILINLHGELFPFPPLRNYSDAAKIPDFLPGVRAVTHPEQLRYRLGDAVKLRVYSYLTNPNASLPANNPTAWLDDANHRPITIVLRNINWFPAGNDIMRITGGTDQDAVPGPDPYAISAAPTVGIGNEMYYSSSIVGADTVIKLYHSPLITPCVDSDCEQGGLYHANDNETRRLYGMEYIPSPVEDLTANIPSPGTRTPAFTQNLTSRGPWTKNTARWIITIPNLTGNGQPLKVETRIGDTTSSGQLYPAPVEPTNLSTTYVYIGDDNWAFGTANTPGRLPFTERYQILGDPRHMPYSDLKRPHVGSGRGVNEDPLGYGYNPYFDDFENCTVLTSPCPAANDLNLMRAEMISTRAAVGLETGVGPFDIAAGSRVFYWSINGGAVNSVTLGTGVTRSTNQVVNELNANAAFNAVAVASNAFGGRVRIVTRATNATIRFHRNANHCGDSVGFSYYDVAHPNTNSRIPWPGWMYTVGTVTYGVKNNGTHDDDGWTTNANNATWPSSSPSRPLAPAGNDRIEMDMSRISQMLRMSLQRTNALWTTMTGWSYYYVGIGNEIGYDAANGFANSIPISNRPFTGAAGSGFEQSIISSNCSWTFPNGCGVKYIKEDVNGGWWGMHWLGELYPDNWYSRAATTADWVDSGNLPTGAGANTFRRVLRASIPTTLFSTNNMPGSNATNATRRTWENGCVNFFWGGTGNPVSTFEHQGWGNADNSQRMADGAEIASRYSLPVPTTMSTARPFGTALGGNVPDRFLAPAYGAANILHTMTEFFRFQPNTALDGSSLISVTDPGNTQNVMYVVANGLSPTQPTGTAFMARWSLLTLIHSYFLAGQYNYTAGNTPPVTLAGTPDNERVKQLPQVTITDPNFQTTLSNPNNINVAWSVLWRRWDGGPYTNTYNAQALAQDQLIPVAHRVLYSRDNGVTWQHALDDSLTQTGLRPAFGSPYLQTTTTFNWNVSNTTNFPQGNYLIRVETFRENLPLHYSFHQFRAFIDRP